MAPIAFLFKGAESRLSDFEIILDSIFRTILAINPESLFHVRSGGILLPYFSQRTTAVSRETVSSGKSVSHTLRDDKELRATLAVAFAASAGTLHHNLEVQTLPAMLLRQPIDCVTVSAIPLSCGDAINEDLKKKLPAYLGFFEVDCGDPLMLELAANLLIPHCHYQDGSLKWIVPSDQGPGLPADTEWASKLPFSSVEVTTDDPQHIRGRQLSAIGAKNSKLLKGRGRSRHAERVLSSLLDSTEGNKNKTDFEIEFGNAEFDRANVSKLPKYCLNDQHTNPDGTPGKGRDKAHLFQRLLGITRDDWLFLGEQLVAGLEEALPNKTRQSKYGIQYEVTIPVTGRNGRTMLVTCPWIIRPGEPPFLVTAYFPDNATTKERGSLAELIVAGPQCPEFWKQLYETAHQYGARAAENWTPTPMWVEGYPEAISEGACGVSWVKLPDARSRFARWLKKNNFSYKGHCGGCFVLARTTSQSLERAREYSEEFARVLRLNGIECNVGWRYD